MKRISLVLIAIILLIATTSFAQEASDSGLESTDSTKEETVSNENSNNNNFKDYLPIIRVSGGYYPKYGAGGSISIESRIMLFHKDNINSVFGFAFTPNIRLATYINLKEKDADYVHIQAQAITPLIVIGRRANYDYEISALSVGFSILDNTDIVTIIGPELSVLRLNHKFYLGNKWNIASKASFMNLTRGEVTILGKSHNQSSEIFNVALSISKSFNWATLRVSGETSVRLSNGISSHLINTEDWEKGDTLKEAAPGRLVQVHTAGRFEIDRIGNSLIGLFYQYNYCHYWHKNVIKIGEGVVNTHLQLIGVQITFSPLG